MSLCDVAELVNGDLENEWKHLTFYTRSAALIQGLHRNHLSAFLFSQAQSELGHVLAFSKQVVALGGIPTEGYTDDLETLVGPVEILQEAIELEREVVVNYTLRKRQLEDALTEVLTDAPTNEAWLLARSGSDVADDAAALQQLILFYEEQIEDSHADLNELRQMIPGVM